MAFHSRAVPQDSSKIEHIYIPDVDSLDAPWPPWWQGHTYLQPQQFDALDLDHYFICDVNRYEEIHWYKLHPRSVQPGA